MENTPKYMRVKNFRTASDPGNPHLAFFQFSTDPEGDESSVFVVDATMLDDLATAFANAAKAIRDRSN